MRMLIGLLALFGVAAPAAAQPAAEFYKGKTIAFVVGFTAGGNYDFYARLLSEFMGRHVPGNPSFVVQNRPGAGSRNAAAYVFNVAPKDGTVIAMTTNLLPLFQVLDAAPKFDLSKAHFLGNMTETVSVLSLWHTAPVKTLDEAKRIEAILGSTGRTGETYIVPQIMNGVLGTKFKIVTGYPGINEISLAMERGELHGRNGSWDNLMQQKPEWVREKKVNILVQVGFTKERELPDVPLLSELAANADDRALLDLVSGYPAFARAPWVAAEVPAYRVAALRKAFDALMKDEAFLADAKKRKLEIGPRNAAQVHALVNKLASASPELVERVKKAIGQID